MEEIDLNLKVSAPLPKDENEFLIMANDFKNRMEEKNKIILDLKKLLINSYGLINVIDKYEDISLVHILQEILEEGVAKHLNIDFD